MSDQDDDEPVESLAKSRSRRAKKDPHGRFAALEKLKNLRTGGVKNKYEIGECQNVYDVVDEKTYSKIVQKRQEEEWIDDDAGNGYVEDGREIFDEEAVDDGFEDDKRRKSRAKKDKNQKEEEKVEKEKMRENFHSIRDMFSSMPAKRKREDNNVKRPQSSRGRDQNDESDQSLLDSLLGELHEEKKPKFSSMQARKIEYAKRPQKKQSDESDQSLLDSLLLEKPHEKKKPNFLPFKKTDEVLDDEYSQIPKDMFDDDVGNGYVEPVEDGREKSRIKNQKEAEKVEKEKMRENKNQKEGEKVEKEKSKDMFSSMPAKGKREDNNVKRPLSGRELTDDSDQFFMDSMFGDDILAEESSQFTKDQFEDSVEFYWFDIFEEPKCPGTIFIFGKIKDSKNNFSSCCLVVKNLSRVVYLLPREKNLNGQNVSYNDIYQEFNSHIAPKYQISMFRSKPTKKKYCFDLSDVPYESSYLEVRYSGTMRQLPQDLTGDTFSKVFGTTTPLMENFLLDKKFKGPSWLKISNAIQVENEKQQSWCKYEFHCEVKDIQVNPNQDIPIPTFTMLSLNIQSVNDAKSKKDNIVFIGVSINKKFLINNISASTHDDGFCLYTKPPGEIWPFDINKVESKRTLKMESERSLLGCFLAKIQQLDPDIYLGHDLNMELLFLQILNHKVPHFSRIGRLKRSSYIGKNNKQIDYRAAVAGRVICDVKISSMELIRARSYDFQNLSMQLLGKREEEVCQYSGPEIKKFFEDSYGIKHLINWGMKHCIINIQLINKLQVLPLALQITSIAGNILSRTLLGGRSERNEYLLLHAFHSKDYIVPDKYRGKFKKDIKNEKEVAEIEEGNKSDKKSSGPSYAGGLVLAPKKGFYDNFIVLMDFNSLYPSIIQEYNICFTTGASENSTDEELTSTDKERGILPEEIRRLVESRKIVKNLMKENVSSEVMKQYDIRQKALKLTANSMYGCLGFKFSRFYAKELAALVTGKGREILMKTKDTVEKMGFEVIYGDTDSIMINSNTTDIRTVFQIGNKIKAEINKMYRLLELEIDGVFRYLLLLKKKKYAARIYDPKIENEEDYPMELKGLDMVRRDWAPIAASTAKLVLDVIMNKGSYDDKIFQVCEILKEVSKNVKEGNVVVKDLLITKQLAKNPEDYKNSTGLYHVEVAKRINEKGILPKKFRTGDTVSYLFCNDGLAHHLREIGQNINEKKEEKSQNEGEDPSSSTSTQSTDSTANTPTPPPTIELKPDPTYYLAQQIHPVVSRICEPIPGLEPNVIAEALGLDPSNYKKRRVYEDSSDDKLMGKQTEAEKYKDCEKFSIICKNCNENVVFESPFINKENDPSGKKILLDCQNCSKPLNPTQVSNKLILFIRNQIKQYYKNVYICGDPACSNKDRYVPLRLDKGSPICSCRTSLMMKEFSDSQLYQQLNYLSFVFDISKHMDEVKTTKNQIQSSVMYTEMVAVSKKYLNSSAYSQLDLQSIFKEIIIPMEPRSFST